MYSPGTIKAIGLMSKGVSSDKAFAQARDIDLQSAQTRINFYTEQSLRASVAPSTAMSVPAAVVTPPAPSTSAKPSAPIASPGKVTQPSSTATVAMSWDDLIKQGYKRNTGDGTYLNGPNSPVPNATGANAAPSQKKIKTFYDQKFMPTPQDELEQQTLTLNSPLKNLSPELYKQIPSLSSGQWGLTDPQAKKNAAADALAKYLTKPMLNTNPYGLETPETTALNRKEQDLAYKSMKGVMNNFLNANTTEELVKAKKVIDSQLKLLSDKADNLPTTSPQQLVNMPTGAAMDIAYSETSKKQSNKADISKVKNALAETYNNLYIEKVSNQVANALQTGALQAKDINQYLKSLDGYKDVAGGLANLGGDFSQIVKGANIDSYLDRPMTQADLELGGQQVFNEQALARFNEKSSLSVSEAVLEDRYNDTRSHIVDTHFKVGSGIIDALTNQNLGLLKRREALITESNSPQLSEKRAKELQNEFAKIEKQVELNDKLIRKTSELHNYDALKKNKEIDNFAGSFLQDQESIAKESKRYYSGDMGSFEKGMYVAHKTSASLLSGAAKLGTELLQGVGGMTGWDSLETFGRYATNYVSVNELVNFDRVNNKGQYQTSNSFMFTDKEGETHYQPTALLYTGAEMAPLVVATVYGAEAVSALGGRVLTKAAPTLVSRGLMSAKRASDFTRALATTRNYGAAYRTVLSQSSNPIAQALAYNVPSAVSLGSIIYPQQFAHAYNDMYSKGIKDARSKAHAVAAVSTVVEIATENMFNDLKYLDDFAEKGIGASKFIKKYTDKWTGSLNQYRALYSDIFGKAFSPKTLDYLAVNSVNALGKAGAGARFMLARGIEEGREEVTAELMNYFADNHMGLAAMKGEPPRELTPEDLVNSFAGALIGPPIGISNQIKQYSENKRYGQLFDIMLNGQFYQNKVNEAVKAGTMKAEQAAQVLAKIQELDSIEKEYGVRNLKNFQSNKSIKTLNDLMEDPYLQFDYFKNILKKKSIDDRLSAVDKATYTDAEKTALMQQAEEAAKNIEQYKRRADFYGQLSQEDKQQILDDNINRKLALSRLLTTESLEKHSQELDELTVQTVANKRSENFTNSVRNYRDGINKIRQEREQAEEDALAANTYNPLVDHIENKTPTTTLADIQSVEDLEDAMTQALIAPDRGKDLLAFMNGLFDQQLDALERDSESVTLSYLESVGKSRVKGDRTETAADGSVDAVPEARDPYDTDTAIADLTDEQQEELAQLLSELNNQYDDILDRKEAVSKVLMEAFNNVAPAEILNIQDPEARDAAQVDWVKGLYERVGDNYNALMSLMQEDSGFSQGVFYDRIRFAEYKADNKDKLEKQIDKKRQEREAQTPPAAEVTERETVTTTETSTETGKPVEVVSPELVPEDITPVLEAGIDELENMPLSETVSTISETTGEIIAEQEYNTDRSEVISQLLGEVLSSPTLESAQAKMRVTMEAAGATPEDINTTLSIMEKVANNEPVFEEEYTHMFNLLLAKANMDLNNLKFTEAEETPVVTPAPAPAPTQTAVEAKQLNLLEDQPRLTPEQLAQREAQERASADEAARQREIEMQEAMADEELYMEYMQEKEAFKMLDLPAEAQALSGNRISTKSFRDFADKANLQGREGKAIGYAYLAERGATVDEVARIASNLAGREITPQDIVDFILLYPGGIGGPKSKSESTYFGRNNPDVMPKYSSILGLAKQREKQARAKARKDRKKNVTLPSTTFSPDYNVAETKENTVKSTKTKKTEPKTEEQVATIQSQNQVVNTSKLFRPSENDPSAKHFEIQENIIQSINKDFRNASTGIVDLFTMIEEVLGAETLTKMEEIFEEVKTGPTSERLQELRSQFMSLLPSNFMDPKKVAYMFDTQIVKNVSQSDLDQVNVKNFNATQEELYQVNKGRRIPEVKLKDGKVVKDTIVRQSGDKLLLLKEQQVVDAEGNEKVKKYWIPFDKIENPQDIFVYPIMGSEPMTFNALNTLAFTVLDSNGKVQRYNDKGDKTETGDKALISYLPTSKAKANPTPEEKVFDEMRKSVAKGNRVTHLVKITGPSITDAIVTLPDNTTKNANYRFDFNTETLTPVEKKMTAAELIEADRVTQEILATGKQQESVDALERLIAKSKSIPDPSKEGYVIDGEKYERQSGFTSRVFEKSRESNADMEKGAAVGNLLDIIGRDVLGGRKIKSKKEYVAEAEEMAFRSKLNDKKGYKLEITDEEFNNLVKELVDFRDELNKKGYKLFTEGLVVYRKYTPQEQAATGFVGVAGAMDIVAIDIEGGVHIIDFKNKKFKNPQIFKSSIYNSNERFPSNVSKWSSQQTAYGILSQDFGLPVRSINILAFASQYEEADGKITINMLSKGSDKVPVLAQNKSDISDAVIKLQSDSKIAYQIKIRTVDPKVTAPVEATTEQLNSIKENIPEFTETEAKNLSIILSSYSLNFADVRGLDPSDETPDTKNPPSCNPPIA